MRVPYIANADKQFLDAGHAKFMAQANKIHCKVTLGIILLIPSLLLILCGGLCLDLPGVNVINGLVYYAFLPASAGVALSIPFLVLAVDPTYENSQLKVLLQDKVMTLLEQALQTIPGKKIEWGKRYVRKNFIPEGNKFYKISFLEGIKKRYEDNKSHPQRDKLMKILEQVVNDLRMDKKPPPPKKAKSKTVIELGSI